MTFREAIVNKVFSGRFIMVVCFTITACYLSAKRIFPMEAFTGIVTLVVREYFVRNDRKNGDPNAKP